MTYTYTDTHAAHTQQQTYKKECGTRAVVVSSECNDVLVPTIPETHVSIRTIPATYVSIRCGLHQSNDVLVPTIPNGIEI